MFSPSGPPGPLRTSGHSAGVLFFTRFQLSDAARRRRDESDRSRDDHTAPLFVEATKQLGALAVQIEKMNPALRRVA